MGLLSRIEDVLPLAVRVAAEEDGAGVSVLHRLERITLKFKHQTLDFRVEGTMNALSGEFSCLALL